MITPTMMKLPFEISTFVRRTGFTCMLVCSLSTPTLGQAQTEPASQTHGHSPAHVHGMARIDIALAGDRLEINLDTPLDSLIGFEHAPRSESQRKAAQSMIAILKNGAQLFQITPGAQCSLTDISLNSPALGLVAANQEKKPGTNQNTTPGNPAGHADLSARYRFTCKNPSRASQVDVNLFAATRHLQRIDLQLAVPAGQFKRTLNAPQKRVSLRK